MWVPTSGCGAHCLRGDEVSVAGPVRRAARIAGLAGVVAMSPALLLVPRAGRERVLRGLARATLRALGVRWSARGRLPRRHALVVANHISWLDIVVLLASGRCRPVAKEEVRDWPLVGRIAASVGAVFLDRTRPRTLPGTVGEVRDALAAGAVVAVFPEGTTSCGEGVGGFRPAFFQAAVDAGAPVVPVTLRFQAGGSPTAQPAFIGEESLLASLRRVLAMRGLQVGVRVGTAIHPGPAASRRTLARIAGAAVGCLPPPVAASPAVPAWPAAPVWPAVPAWPAAPPAVVPLAPVVPFPAAAPERVDRAA
jgi:1-acyl-sn-glycerol-3-phosphate acyltransferase